jgi:hypothetical protein
LDGDEHRFEAGPNATDKAPSPQTIGGLVRRSAGEQAEAVGHMGRGQSTLETDFHVVANRLCRIRSGDDLVEDLAPDVDGFLEPSGLLISPSGPLIPGGLIAPEDMAVSAFVLLGEPGIGKSTAFERLLADSRPDHLVRVDGASLTDATFYDLIGRHLEIVVPPRNFERGRAEAAEAALTIVIDQLDESPMIRRFPQAFDRASGARRVEGLRVYVACRAADYPTGLTAVLDNVCGGCTVADLAPLTRTEAERLAGSIPGVDGAALVDAAVRAGAGALASVPLTLGLLARTFLREGGALDGSSTAIFAKAVDQLLGPHADSAHPPMSSSLDQRRAIAGRAAALLLLSGRRTIWTGRPLLDGPQDVREDALVGGTEQVPNGSFEVTRQFVLETLSSGLFAARGANRSAFRHGSIAAYLAARHIVAKNMAREQLESLFLVAGPDDVRSIPTTLRETAAWLVSIAPEHSSWLAHADPESFVAHSRVVDVPVVKQAIVEALLARAPEIELGQLPWRHSRWELGHPGLGAQLSGVLAHEEQPDDWDTLARVRLAVRLVEQTGATDLLEPLIRLVENERWGAATRAQAARAAMRIASEAAAPRMIAVLDQLRDSENARNHDPDDELLGTLLDALYPQFLGLAHVLPHIHRRQNPNLFGMYMVFLTDFPKRLPEDALDEVLEWAAGQRLADDDEIEADTAETSAPASVRDRSELPMDVVFGVLDRATTVTSVTERLDRIAAILGPLLFTHRRPPLPVGLTLIDDSGDPTQTSRDHSRRLALSLAEVQITRGASLDRADAWELVHGWSTSPTWRSDGYVPEGATRSNRSSLLDAEDLRWLYDEISERAKGGATGLVDLLAKVGNQLFDTLDNALASFIYERQSHPAWSVLRSRFDAVPLDSEFARMMQRHRKKHREEDQTRSDHEVEAAVGKLEEQLDAAVAGDTEAFWRFTYGCQADPRTGTGKRRFDDEITTFPGFQALGQPALERYDAASLHYVTYEDDHGESWLGTDQFDWRAWAGYIALSALERAGMLDEIPAPAWKHWVSASLWFPAYDASPMERKKRLLARCAENAERLLAAAVEVYTLGEVNRGSVPDLRGIPFTAPAVRDKSFELLGVLESSWRELPREDANSATTSEGVAQALLNAWGALVEGLGHAGPAEVNGNLQRLWRHPDEALAPLAARAAVAMYAVDPPGTWRSLVITKFVGGEQLAELVGSLAYAGGTDQLASLSAAELATSYELLSHALLPAEDQNIADAHWVNSDEQARRLRDELIALLAAQGTEHAVLELARLAAAHPERLVIRSALLQARVALFAAAWIPPLPEEVARLIADAERRLVRSDEELLQLVLRTLRKIEREYRSHADLLWDRVPKRFLTGRLNEDGWLPKPEAALSGYLAHELTIRLHGRGMAVNREVLVRPTDAYGAGERTDILVEAVTGAIQPDDYRPNRLALVIEVKGAWNRGLQAEQRTQLAERYLPEVNAGAGIYLVGWFPPEQWAAIREPGRGRAAALRPATLDTRLAQQADEIRNNLGRLVVPVRMVFDRPARVRAPGTDR